MQLSGKADRIIKQLPQDNLLNIKKGSIYLLAMYLTGISLVISLKSTVPKALKIIDYFYDFQGEVQRYDQDRYCRVHNHVRLFVYYIGRCVYILFLNKNWKVSSSQFN